MKEYQPTLEDLTNFDFTRIIDTYCDNCNIETQHELYDGHTFAEGDSLIVCLICKRRSLI